MLDESSPPKRGSISAHVAKWVLCIGAAVGAILFMRHLKSLESNPIPFPRSLEVIRRSVERAIDPDATKIDATPSQANLAQIVTVARPTQLDADRFAWQKKRIAPFETHIWALPAKVTEVYLRPDGDLILIIEGGGARTSAELPDPKLCVGSPFHDRIAQLRENLDRQFHPVARPKVINREAELTGIGFFGTAGTRGNGARIEPLLDLRWSEK